MRNNRKLYETIMTRVAKEVKRALNESSYRRINEFGLRPNARVNDDEFDGDEVDINLLKLDYLYKCLDAICNKNATLTQINAVKNNIDLLSLQVNFYKVRNKKQLSTLIYQYYFEIGYDILYSDRRNDKICNLNFIDVSSVTDFSLLFYYFEDNHRYCFNIEKIDVSQWDVSNVTNMQETFRNVKFIGDISNWDVSSVSDMSRMFNGSDFNGDISRWDVSNVEDMSHMFETNYKFNRNISNWDVSGVKNMLFMFCCTNFNGDISKWDVSNVENMSNMFSNARTFNGDISNWDVSNVLNMDSMFYQSNFNQDISNWHINTVICNADSMFAYCDIDESFKPIIQEDINIELHPKNYRQLSEYIKKIIEIKGMLCDLNNIDTSKITDMSGLFYESDFNGDISKWDVSNVENMEGMFYKSAFNGDISDWDVSKVKNMSIMFYGSKFSDERILDKWDNASVTEMSGMFYKCPLLKKLKERGLT